MIRLFAAVEIPKNIQVYLHSMGRSLHGGRPVPEEQIHITLRFIGEVDGALFHDIRENLREVKSQSFDLGIRGVGHFPPRGKPRVIWAGLKQSDPLARLKKKIDSSLLKCGLPPENRKFSPHVTIARLKNCSMQRVTDFLSGNAFLEFEDFRVDCFHLFSSKLSQKGATHIVEESYPLLSD